MELVLQISHTASGQLTFISFGQANAIACTKSAESLWFVVPNIWELEHHCHGDFAHTFDLVSMPKWEGSCEIASD